MVIVRWLAAAALAGALGGPARAENAAVWTVPEVAALPHDAHGLQVREGRDLVTATYAYVGPNVSDPSKRYAGNNLACTNCHLQAGAKKFGLPLFGLYGDFPQCSVRWAGEISIEDRINYGRPMPADAPEMQAIVAYIKFLSTGVSPGQKLPGLGSGRMPELHRAADPKRGQPFFARVCAGCHGSEGEGIRIGTPTSALGYVIPPLWGADSFNDGAGMARLITLANFIHFNMPHGTDYLDPQLSVENAWDIAAYALSQTRPQFADQQHDFPDLLQKPVDTPYGPYADHFSERQHKYGPFAPIPAAIAKLEHEKGAH